MIEIQTKKTISKINKTKSWFFGKINKINKPLPRVIKKNIERTQISKIRNEKGEATTDSTQTLRIITDYYEQLYANKMEQYGRNEQFLRKLQSPLTEPGRNTKYKQSNHKH